MIMNIQKVALGQPLEEIQAAMQEEDCAHCFGCPYATMRAAEIVHRTNLLLNFTFDTQAENTDLHTGVEGELVGMRGELKSLTDNCNGYSDVRREKGRPAKMCDSPESKDLKISIVAGRILELLRIT